MTSLSPDPAGYISAAQMRAGRALLGWSQADLAKRANVGPSTVADFERGQRTPIANTAAAMKSALEEAGITFQPGGAIVGPAPTMRRAAQPGGSPPRWIDATDLAQWGERRDAQDTMPELLSRLIRAATGLDAKLRFPAKESVQRPGWDGFCDVGVGTEHVPTGTSRWEIGTQRKAISAKADEDYEKRLAKPMVPNRRQATFVFVTPQRWNDKAKWAQRHHAERKWGDVRAYDADDLVHWIELYPAVGHWLAVKIGKRPASIRQLDEVFQEWSLATRVPLSSELILAGRDDEAAAVLRWLREPPSLFAVQGETTEEAIAFLHAAIRQLPPEYSAPYAARCLMADTADAARVLGDSPSPLIIVLEDAEPGLVARLSQRGHHVYVVYGWDAGRQHGARILSRPSRFILESILRDDMKIASDEARRLAAESSRSLAVLRRLMPVAPGQIPRWAAERPSKALLAAVLAGAWDESEEGDRAMIARLAGMNYDGTTAELVPWIGVGDSPLRKSGSVWKITSPRDAWFLLARFFSGADIDLYQSVALDVLGAGDPRFEMDAEERWYAPLKGVQPPYSGYLRRGLGETLILLALFGYRASSVNNPSLRAEHVVRKLLAGADARCWWSLSKDFQLLAESAPESFMEAVDDSLDQAAPAIKALFGEDGGLVFGHEHLSDLLWALETLALSPTYLARSVGVLARLAAIDPGGRFRNRPGNSLQSIFLPFHPQTHASFSQRLSVLDTLRKLEPNIAWKLMLGLLPSSVGVLVGSSPAPRWRDFSGDEIEPITSNLIAQATEAISSRLLIDAGVDAGRWKDLIGAFANLMSSRRAEAVQRLMELAPLITEPDERLLLWGALRNVVHHHRSFADADWALPRAEVDLIATAYDALTPSDFLDQITWLFNEGANIIPEPAGHDWQKNVARADKLRRQAIGKLLAERGLDGITALARRARMPRLVGATVGGARIARAKKDEILALALRGAEAVDAELAEGMIARMFAEMGETWANKLLDRAKNEHWGAEAVTRVLCALPAQRWVWDCAAADSAVSSLYWKRVHPFLINGDAGEVTFAIERLIEAGRALHAIDLAGHNVRKQLPSELLSRLLLAAVKQERSEQPDDSNQTVMLQHFVEEILLHLDERNELSENDMARLEWAYLPLLTHSRREPKALEDFLARSPTFFVEVLSALYRPDPESGVVENEHADSEHAAAVAKQAFDLLQSWRRVPGSDGATIDAAALKSWMTEARTLSAKVGRGRIADQTIGHVLAKAGKDADGFWPPIGIRDAIESARSRELEQGIAIGVLNKQGVTVRSPTDGGQQERDLAAFYRASSQAVASEWRRTSALLDRIAKDFEQMAERHDESAERWEWER